MNVNVLLYVYADENLKQVESTRGDLELSLSVAQQEVTTLKEELHKLQTSRSLDGGPGRSVV